MRGLCDAPRKDSRPSAGFTIVEVAVVVPIVSVIIIGVFAIILALVQSAAAERVGAQNLYDIHASLDTIQNDASLSSAFLARPDPALTDADAPKSGWSYEGGGDGARTLILRSYATTTNPLSATRQPVFYNDQGCDASSLYLNSVMTYDTVYFVKDGTLYRRRLVTQAKPTCEDPYQKQSCSVGFGCGTDDEAIVSGVSAFSVDYYATSADMTPTAVYGGGDNLVSGSNSAGVTLSLTRRAYGQPLASTMTLRISKLITGKSQ